MPCFRIPPTAPVLLTLLAALVAGGVRVALAEPDAMPALPALPTLALEFAP